MSLFTHAMLCTPQAAAGAAVAPAPTVLLCARCQPVSRLPSAVVNLKTSGSTPVCKARSSRLQLLVPDPADAVLETDTTAVLVAADVDEGASDSNLSAVATLLEAYPCSTASSEGAAAVTAAAWTASDDADIDDADWALSTAYSQQQQQQQWWQQQQPRGRQNSHTALQESLPVLTPLHPDGALQQQHTLLRSSAGGEFITTTSSSAVQQYPEADRGAAVVRWKASQLPDAAAGGLAAAAAAAAAAPTPNPAADSSAAQTAAAAADDSSAVGSFFGSRVSMLLQLKQQQLLVQRQHVLARKRQQLYRYTVAQDGSSIEQQPSSAPISPLKQTSFPLAKRQPMQQQQQQPPPPQQQQQQQQHQSSNSSSLPGAGLQTARDVQQQQQAFAAPLRSSPGDLQPPVGYLPHHHQHQQPQQPAPASALPTGQPAGPSPQDPSRGLSLSAFLYCCSRNELLSLTWQLGLAPSALRFVSRVADADVVLHVKPGKGQRHYQYEEYRAQAAEKGIPFVDLKNLSLLELQLYLLPVFRLYAGELSPRDLLLRKKRRGPKKRYASIKLPAARASQ